MGDSVTVVLFEGQKADAAALVRWAIRVAAVKKRPAVILSCYEEETPRKAIPDAGKTKTKESSTLSAAALAVIADNSDIDIEIWTLAHSDPGQAIISFVDEQNVETLIVGADCRVSMDATAAPIEERLLRFTPCAVMVLDVGTTDGGTCTSILIPMGDDLAVYALKASADLLPLGLAEKIVPLLVGQEFGEDAEAVAQRELELELKKAGVKEHAAIQPAVCLSANSTEGIVDQAEKQDANLIVIGATTTRALRNFRAHEGSHSLGTTPIRPAIAVARPEKIRTTGIGDFIFGRILRWLPKLDPSERLELFDRLQAGARWDKNFSVMIGLSTAIASLGLIQSSSAVVIGAMLVAPLMTPLIAAGLSLVQGNIRLFRSSGRAMVFGVLSGLSLSVIIGLITPNDELSQEILARGSPTILDLLVALLSGMAAAYVIAQPSLLAAMAGVAIAAALIPPLSCIGLSATAGEWRVAIGAATLLTINLIAIILGAALVFRAVGAQGTKLGVGRPLWVRRAVMFLVLATIGFSAPLGFRLSDQIRIGQDRPLLHPLNPRLELALHRRVDAVPGVSILLLGRSNSRWERSVGVHLIAKSKTSKTLIDDLRSIIKSNLGQEVTVHIDVLQAGEIDVEE